MLNLRHCHIPMSDIVLTNVRNSDSFIKTTRYISRACVGSTSRMLRVLLQPSCDHTQGHRGDSTPTSIWFLVWISSTVEVVWKFRRIVALVVARGHIRLVKRPWKPTQLHNDPARSPAQDQRNMRGRMTACCDPRDGLNPENGDTTLFRNTDVYLPDLKLRYNSEDHNINVITLTDLESWGGIN